MTSRGVIIIGFVVLLVLLVGSVVVSHLRGSRLGTLSETLAYLTHSRPTRLVAVLVWAWLGWHFLAR